MTTRFDDMLSVCYNMRTIACDFSHTVSTIVSTRLFVNHIKSPQLNLASHAPGDQIIHADVLDDLL